MANIDKNGYIKTEDASGNIVTLYPYTKAGNVDGLDVFGASGSGHSSGLVPDPGATSGSSKFLCENGTWAEPSGGGGAVTGVKGNSESSYRTGNVNLTPANIGAATSDHTHGNITNDGKLQTTDVSIASGDKLVITDSSDSSKIARASVSFDGSTTTQFLSKKGTWETPSGGGVTGVKGSNESSYRTGNVSLSYSNVGAASSSHTHSDYVKQAYYTSNKTSGSLNDLSEGRVYCSSNCTGGPVSANMMVETIVDYNGSYKTQKAEVMSGTYAGCLYTRYYSSGSWSSWINLTPQQLKSEELYFGLPGQSWTKSAAGMYYCGAKSATTLTEVYAATIDGWTGLKATDMVAVTINGISSNQVSLMANVNIFSSGSWIKVKAFGV